MIRNVSMEGESEGANRALPAIGARASSAGTSGTTGVSPATITQPPLSFAEHRHVARSGRAPTPAVIVRRCGRTSAHRIRPAYRYPLLQWRAWWRTTGSHRSAVYRRYRRGGGGFRRSAGSTARNWPASCRLAAWGSPTATWPLLVPATVPVARVAIAAFAQRWWPMTRMKRC
jgi:hypothetical protein